MLKPECTSIGARSCEKRVDADERWARRPPAATCILSIRKLSPSHPKHPSSTQSISLQLLHMLASPLAVLGSDICDYRRTGGRCDLTRIPHTPCSLLLFDPMRTQLMLWSASCSSFFPPKYLPYAPPAWHKACLDPVLQHLIAHIKVLKDTNLALTSIIDNTNGDDSQDRRLA